MLVNMNRFRCAPSALFRRAPSALFRCAPSALFRCAPSALFRCAPSALFRRAPSALFRRATPQDVAAASEIIESALDEYALPFEPDGRDADVKQLGARPDHDDFIVERAGRVVGVGSVGPHGDDGVAWISKVFVANDARRAGVGRALLAALHDAARQRGYIRVGLRTRLVFRHAIALYESVGYARVAYDPAVLSSGDVVYFCAL